MSRRRRWARWPAVALLAAALLPGAGCGPPRPVQRAAWTGTEDLDAFLRADAEALQAVTDLTAEVRFTLRRVGAASGSILFQPPALLRLDVRGPLFQHILSAVLDGDRLTAAADGRTYRMAAADGLQAFLDIDLAGYDPRLALLGVVSPGRRGIAAADYPRADRARLTLDDGVDGRRRVVWLDLQRGFVEREELLADDGTSRWTRQLSGWRRIEGSRLYLPAKIRIDSGDRVLELEYGRVRLDRGLRRETFFSGIADPG